MAMDVHTFLAPLVTSLRQRPGVLGIAVMGSFARGEPRAGSDIDIGVLTDESEPHRVEVLTYAGRPTEVVYFSEAKLQEALRGPSAARMITSFAAARPLHDPAGGFARIVADIQTKYAAGPGPQSDEDRRYALFQLAHLKGLVAELATATDMSATATCSLIVAQAVRTCVETLLAVRQQWPVGWRSTLDALKASNPELIGLAEAALLKADHEALSELIDRVSRYAADGNSL